MNFSAQGAADSIRIKGTALALTFQPPVSVLAAENWNPQAYGVKNNILIVANSYYSTQANNNISAFYLFSLSGDYIGTVPIPLNLPSNIINIAPSIAQSGNTCFFLCTDAYNEVALFYDGTTPIALGSQQNLYSEAYGDMWIDNQLNINTESKGNYNYIDTKGKQFNIELPNQNANYSYLGNGFFGVNTFEQIYNINTKKTVDIPSSYDVESSSEFGNNMLLFGSDVYQVTPKGSLMEFSSGDEIVGGLFASNGILSILLINDEYMAGACFYDNKLYYGNKVTSALSSPGSYSYFLPGIGLFSLLYQQTIQFWPLEITFPLLPFNLPKNNRLVRNMTLNGHLRLNPWR